MQLYALTLEKRPVFANAAERHKNYLCAECEGIVRLRGGFQRQKHFFHLQSTPSCRQNGKSLTHIGIQNYFLELFKDNGSCTIEKRFKQINRIADVALEDQKMIFEIQCSPIDSQEILARNLDYQSLGYTVVWILHEKNFNKQFYTAAEKALNNHPFFFTNMDETGNGCIYDQFDLFDRGIRRFKTAFFPVDLRTAFVISDPLKVKRPAFIRNRLKNWPVYFQNDLVSLALDPSQSNIITEHMLQSEKEMESVSKKSSQARNLFKKFIADPYWALFHLLLEKACR